MIKRPLNSRFSDKVKAGTKFTTIRENPWPVGAPIMLYNWRDKAYRSPQDDVCAVEVITAVPINISFTPEGMRYSVHRMAGKLLWQSEGFDSGEEMDAWFAEVVKPGQTVTKHLMHFKKLEVKP